MSGHVYVIGPREVPPRQVGDYWNGMPLINTTSRSPEWRGLSPFYLGPCKLYSGHIARRMENGWQYSKVYAEHLDTSQVPRQCDAVDHPFPSDDYWAWAQAGWANDQAVRYPMGRGRKPLYSWWRNRQLDYVQARKKIYVPLYRDAVRKEEAWKELRRLHAHNYHIVLWDFDGYDYVGLGIPLEEVLEDPKRKMGHAFVLAMMLKGIL